MRPFCLLMLAGSLCWAQGPEASKEPAKFYKLEFVVKELEGGKTLTARSYSILLNDVRGVSSQIRADSKVPVGDKTLEVGTNIECSYVAESHDEVTLRLFADVNSLLQETERHPVIIRENRWSSNVIVPLKKPTVVFSSDDNTTKHVMQLEVTATPRL